MVLLAASDEDTLDKLTAAVTANDPTMGESPEKGMCLWVPAGVAVIPEEKIRVDGRIQWRPVK
jgi:hypothetical protein